MKASTDWLGTRGSHSKREATLPSKFQPAGCNENKPRQVKMSRFLEREVRVYPQRWQRDDEF